MRSEVAVPGEDRCDHSAVTRGALTTRLVQVMDTVRVLSNFPVAPFLQAALFPDIAIADAPI